MKSVTAKKHLGQHFLKNSNIAQKITELLDKESTQVLEIGPGMGILTQFLIKNNYTTNVIEIDNESVVYLKSKYPNLRIYEGDFLNIDIKKQYPFQVSLIGNFPYNISSQILFKTYENKNQIHELIGMFQKEVAQRIVAKKGKQRGILSVLLQTFYNIEYCFDVDRSMFIPPPKVQSGVIKMTRNRRNDIGVDELKFKKIVKTTFNQRRKTVKNALKPLKIINQEAILDLLHLRAEQLSVDDFIKLTSNVE